MDERDKSYRDRAGEHFAANPVDPWPDDAFGAAVISGELPDFWKPDEPGDFRKGEIVAVRETKDFGDHQGRAIHVRGVDGSLVSIPISAGLESLEWRAQVGKVFKFTFMGFQKTKDGFSVRTFVVQPLRYRVTNEGGTKDEVPF
jgi:hypothetical protein